ncbi:hypothetical protein HGM15179_018804, partial [Zosterops borbonicus]
TFGKGTKLLVKPNVTPSPSVYRLTSKDDQDLEMCLITDYSPENLTVNSAEHRTSAVVGVATEESKEESSYLSTYWARRDQLQCAASHEGFGELEGEDPESGASAICVTGIAVNFKTRLRVTSWCSPEVPKPSALGDYREQEGAQGYSLCKGHHLLFLYITPATIF